jgi:hypothetical protein
VHVYVPGREDRSMTRTIKITIDVGDTTPESCGQCPFRTLDWEGGEPKGREFCSCPSWDMREVTGGVRHRECLEAEAA